MGKTYRSEEYKNNKGRREGKSARKETGKRYRQKDKLALRKIEVYGEEVEFDPRTGTSGWLTH
jgi:hypothetical protein